MHTHGLQGLQASVMKAAMAAEASLTLLVGRKVLTVVWMTPVGGRMLLIVVWVLVPRIWMQLLLEEVWLCLRWTGQRKQR